MTEERLFMAGNEAAAEAAIRAGCRHYFGYPITPQNEITAYMARRMPEAGGVFVQAESEVAAINMCFGCAAAGRRVLTSSSSPGISLKQEGISYAAGAELPIVIINVMRGGPGLGNIEPAQGDYFQSVKGGGHGDYRLIVLAPHTVQEFADLTGKAFDLADHYRNPVLVLADGLLGQMMEPLVFAPPAPDVLPEKDWALTGAEGRAQRIVRSFFLKEGVLHEHCVRLQAKYDRMQRETVQFEARATDDADVVLVAYGSSARVCLEVVRRARRDGLRIGLLRPISLWPFPDAPIRDLAERGKRFVAVEMSAGQMVEDVRLAVNGRAPVGFAGRSGGGMVRSDAVLAEAQRVMKG